MKSYVERKRYLQSQGWKLVCFAPELWTDPHQGEAPRYDGGLHWPDAVFIARRRQRDRERRLLVRLGFTRERDGWSHKKHPNLHWTRVQAVAFAELRQLTKVFRGRG